jgi:hypothetical protein
MSRFADVPTLAQAQDQYLRGPLNKQMPFLFEPTALEPSEANRLFTLISDRSGRISRHHAGQLQQYFESTGSPPPPRIGTAPETTERTVPRSRLIDQFYSHQLEGIRHSAFSDMRRLIDRQIALQQAARNGTELLSFAMRNLTEAFPEVVHANFSHHGAASDESSRTVKLPPCPTRYMEASIAMVLEHIEHITLNLQRIDNPPEEREESPPDALAELTSVAVQAAPDAADKISKTVFGVT